jgi:predicted DNA-binding protein YlxM (UPF0122 family)
MAKISSDMCNEIRKRVKSSEKMVNIAEDMNFTSDAISYHAFGECGHSVSETALTTYKYISKDECKEIRQCYKNDRTMSEIGEAFGRSKSSVLIHINANCQHDVTENLSESTSVRMSKTDCKKLRRKARTGINIDKLAERASFHKSTIMRHVAGRCWHDMEVSSVDLPKFTNVALTEKRCNNARKIFRNSSDKRKDKIGLQHKYNCNESVLWRHLQGKCDCEVDEEPVDYVSYNNITPGVCQKMRRMYDSDTTYSFIANYVGTTISTVGFHVKAQCKHDVEEDLTEKYK